MFTDRSSRQRGWAEREVKRLTGYGDPVIGSARTEMFPTQH